MVFRFILILLINCILASSQGYNYSLYAVSDSIIYVDFDNGQSNVHHADTADLVSYLKDYASTNQKIMYGGTMQDYEVGVNHVGYFVNGTGTSDLATHGSDTKYLYRCDTAGDNRLYIKTGYGGKCLAQTGAWDFNVNSTGEGWDQFKDLIDTLNIIKINFSQYEFRFSNYFFKQSECDASNATYASNYYNNFVAFKDSTEKYTGTDIRWVILKLNDNSNFTYESTIFTAQQNLATNFDNVVLLDGDSFELEVDNIHYTSNGYEDIGDLEFINRNNQ